MLTVIRRCVLLGAAVLSLAPARAQILDLTFNPGTNSDVVAVATQPDGKILVGGLFARIAGQTRNYLARLLPNGVLDPSFNPVLSGSVYSIVLQPDGKILIGGFFSTVGGVPRGRLARLNPDGSLDPTFNAEVGNGGLRAILLQPDRRIVIGGSFGSVGGLPRLGLARVLPDGSLDGGFSADITGYTSATSTMVIALARQANGAILVGGQFGSIKGQARPGLARVMADGTFDSTFDAQLSPSVSINSLAVQQDGRILVGGSFSAAGGLPRINLARLEPTGSADPAFNPRAERVVRTIVEQSDGRILVGGYFAAIGASPRQTFARLLADGSVDPDFSFDATGAISSSISGVETIHVSSDGRIMVGGSFSMVGGVARSGIARLVPPAPAVVQPPVDTAVAIGTNLMLSVMVTGSPAAYQWRRNGVAIAGATRPALEILAVQSSDAGRYDVVVSNSYGSVVSTAATVTFTVPPVITRQPAAVAAPRGQTVVFTVEASGTPAPVYQWSKNGVAISGATSSTLTLAAVQPTDAGEYSCLVFNSTAVPSATATLTVLPAARLANVSVRTTLASAQSLIVGFVVGGGRTDVLVRAAGPALAQFGLATAMADPRIELFQESTKLIENDNWPSVLTGTFGSVGAFPFAVNSRDAALLQTTSGARSIVTSGAAPGVVLVEAYDTGTSEGPRLVNVSARNRVGTGDDVLIAGFAIAGHGSLRVLIRAVGPTLGGVPFIIPGVLSDPKLELFGAQETKIAENDDWSPGLAAEFLAAGAFGLAPGGKDAALVATLNGGSSYTALVKGVNGSTGIALVEIYELP